MCIGMYRPFLGIPWGMFSRCTCTTIFGIGFCTGREPCKLSKGSSAWFGLGSHEFYASGGRVVRLVLCCWLERCMVVQE